MQTPLVQYQAHAGPPAVPAVPAPARGETPLPPPPLRRYAPPGVALLPPFAAYALDTLPPGTPTLAPFVRRRPPAAEGASAAAPPSALPQTVPAKCDPNAPDVTRRPRPRQPGQSVRPVEPSLYTFAGWAPATNRPTARARRNPAGGSVSPQDRATLPVNTAFVRDTERPTRRRTRPVPANQTVRPVADPATADAPVAWLREPTLPARPKRLRQPGGAVLPVPLPALAVRMGWLREPVLPQRFRRLVRVGLFAAPAPLADAPLPGIAWFRETVWPTRRPVVRQPGLFVRPGEPSLVVVPPLDWLQPCAVWLRRYKRPVATRWHDVAPLMWVENPYTPAGRVVDLVGYDRSEADLVGVDRSAVSLPGRAEG